MLDKMLLVAALGLFASPGLSASRPAVSIKAKQTVLPNRAAALLYDQSDNDNGTGIPSLNFLDFGFDAYDAEGADDFIVPAGEIWAIKEVYVDGTYFDGPGSAESFNITFYKSRKGAVGEPVASCPDAPYRFDTHFDLGSEYVACKVKLPKGKYFIGVQANAFFSTAGEWGWLTNNAVRQRGSQWRNPGDGFQTGCTDFAPTLECIPADEGGDYSFALYGRARDAGP